MGEPLSVSFGVVTTNRPGNYVHGTLASLNQTGFFAGRRVPPLHLFVDSEDSSYLESSPFRREFIVVKLAKERGDAIKFSPYSNVERKQRIAWNHARALEFFSSAAGFVAIFEDDLRFAAGWLPRLEHTIRSLVDSFGRRWILSLFVPTSTVPMDWYRDAYWCPYPYQTFTGQQGLLFPSDVARARGSYLMETCVLVWSELPADHSLSVFARNLELPILATAPCLVQHMGKISAGGGGGHLVAASFLESLL